jgi:hypothetical protein
VTGEDRPHRGRRDTDAEASQFADDPPVAPGRVLACEPNNQHLYSTLERRPSRASVRIGPAPLDQLTVPAKQRRRTHRQTPPGAPRQRPRERCEDCPIHGPKRSSPRLAAQNRQLMPEHEDLQLLRALRSAQQHDQLKQPTERHIEERPNHPRPPESGEGEGIEPPAKPPVKPLTEFLNPTGSPSLPTSRTSELAGRCRVAADHLVDVVDVDLAGAVPGNRPLDLLDELRKVGLVVG